MSHGNQTSTTVPNFSSSSQFLATMGTNFPCNIRLIYVGKFFSTIFATSGCRTENQMQPLDS